MGERRGRGTGTAIFVVHGWAEAHNNLVAPELRVIKRHSLFVGRFVLSPDPDNYNPTGLLVDLIENPVIPPDPDPELILPTSHFVVTAWPWIRLEVHDGPGHAKKCLVVQFK